jgi:hypothetical protein
MAAPSLYSGPGLRISRSKNAVGQPASLIGQDINRRAGRSIARARVSPMRFSKSSGRRKLRVPRFERAIFAMDAAPKKSANRDEWPRLPSSREGAQLRETGLSEIAPPS